MSDAELQQRDSNKTEKIVEDIHLIYLTQAAEASCVFCPKVGLWILPSIKSIRNGSFNGHYEQEKYLQQKQFQQSSGHLTVVLIQT